MSGMFAVIFSVVAAFLAAFLGGVINEETSTITEPGWWFGVNCLIAIGCFRTGSWCSLRGDKADAVSTLAEQSIT